LPPAPPAPANTPTKLIPNIQPPLATNVGDLGARYLLLKDLIPRAQQAVGVAGGSGWQFAQSMKPIEKQDLPQGRRPPDPERIRNGRQQQWNAAIAELQKVNDMAYKNRPLDFNTVPELAIPTLIAPGEEDFTGNDEATQRARYDFRRMYFLTGNVRKQGDALVADLEKEQASVIASSKQTAEGKGFLQDLK
jgi:hypothetical protein